MPMPVSLTDTSTEWSFDAALTSIRPPSGVKLRDATGGACSPVTGAISAPPAAIPRHHSRLRRIASASGERSWVADADEGSPQPWVGVRLLRRALRSDQRL